MTLPASRPTERTKLTPPELARQWGVSPEKIIHFIAAGELPAINVATRLGGRPRWLIDLQDIAAFEARRAAQPKPRQRRRRKQAEAEGETWF